MTIVTQAFADRSTRSRAFRTRQLMTLSCASAMIALATPETSAFDDSDQRPSVLQIVTPVPQAASLARFHELLGSEPHVAGTPGDWRAIEMAEAALRDMGLDVHRHEFWALLARPIDARLEIVQSHDSSPADDDAAPSVRRGVMALALAERNLLEDPSSAHPDLTWGWNAYSGSGEVTAGVVYANYGTAEDFATLARFGVDVRGKIVLARYGANFRGMKARFAEEAGAAGLIIYTDPKDSGFIRGKVYPEGGWANDTCIQRGSIMHMPFPGDPLTPGWEATEDAKRIPESQAHLPTIPVQPVGYAAAHEILKRMAGRELPEDLVERWQGGLPCAYRLEGGSELRVRLMVKQERAIMKTANIIARIEGWEHPEQEVIVGCHHDAWGFGACDPLAGTMVVFECARSFAEALKQGVRPRRTVLFALWGAEEFGIIGSTEYVESRREALERNAVAYINLDMAAMGPDFGSSASPSLQWVIAQAAASVPAAASAEGLTVAHAWKQRQGAADVGSSFGDLGGGSDHVAFLCHAGVPSCSMGGGGSAGTAYHSNYDTIAWYRHVVGDDYEPALMIARMVNGVTARLADDPVLPLDSRAFAVDIRRHVAALEARASALGRECSWESLRAAVDELDAAANRAFASLEDARNGSTLSDASRSAVNAVLMRMDRAWLHHEGTPVHPWFRSMWSCSDPDSGYSPWMLPALRWCIERGDETQLARWMEITRQAIARLTADCHDLAQLIEQQ